MPESSTRSIARQRDLVHVEQAALFFLYEVVERVGDLHGALAGALAEHAGEHLLHAACFHVLRRLVADELDLRHIAVAGLDLDHAIVKAALAKLLAEPVFFAGAFRVGLRHYNQARSGILCGLCRLGRSLFNAVF